MEMPGKLLGSLFFMYLCAGLLNPGDDGGSLTVASLQNLAFLVMGLAVGEVDKEKGNAFIM